LRTVVADASAVVDYLLQTPGSLPVTQVLGDSLTDLHLPALCDVEVCAALRRAQLDGRLTLERCSEALADYLDLPATRHGHSRLLVRVLKLFGWDPHHFGRNRDIDLQALVEEGDFPVHAEVDIRSVRKEKEAAGACHASQEGLPRRGLLSLLTRWWDRKEQFMQAIPEGQEGQREKDLFGGVES